MAQQHDRSGVIRFCRQVIRANPSLSDADLDEQIDSVWKSGYLAGRKAVIREYYVRKGVKRLRHMRQENIPDISIDSNRKESTS